MFIIASPLIKLTSSQFLIDFYYLTAKSSNLPHAFAKKVLSLVSQCPSVSSFLCQLLIWCLLGFTAKEEANRRGVHASTTVSSTLLECRGCKGHKLHRLRDSFAPKELIAISFSSIAKLTGIVVSTDE